jgi:hypothetical protein
VGVIYRLSILVSADESQPIQKIIGSGCLMSGDTINHIFGIGCTMSADTNNVSGIRRVTPPTQNPNHGEILVCAVRLPKFPALCAATSLGASAASLDTVSSHQPRCRPYLQPRHRRQCLHRRPRPPSLSLTPSHYPRPCHANPVADPTFGLDATGSAPVIIPDSRRRPRPRRTIPDPIATTPLLTPPSASTPSAVPPSSSRTLSHHPRPHHANPIVDLAFGLDTAGNAPVIIPDPCCCP